MFKIGIKRYFICPNIDNIKIQRGFWGNGHAS